MSKKQDNERRDFFKVISYMLMFFFLILGFTLGILYKVFFPTIDDVSYKQIRSGGYEFINPLIDFETTDSTKIVELVKLENDLRKYVEGEVNSYTETNVSNTSIYYKDLNSGAWIGINEDEYFSLSSLLKLPIMIAAYKTDEIEDGYLDKTIVLRKDETLAKPNILPEKTLVEGETYTLDALINQLIIYSDNEVLAAIKELTNYESLVKVYQDLGLRNPYEAENENTLTVKDYASFFRILYNATYLNKDMSEKALKLLSQVQYDEGIASGIPFNIKVANKFGEREYTLEPIHGRKQLHDCGIIYHPKKPYILCVMTKGSNFESLQRTIKEISTNIYQKVNTE